jgi:hypothetical protein
MLTQPADLALSTADLVCGLNVQAEEPKCTFRDLAASSGQIGVAVSLCWMLHILL